MKIQAPDFHDGRKYYKRSTHQKRFCMRSDLARWFGNKSKQPVGTDKSLLHTAGIPLHRAGSCNLTSQNGERPLSLQMNGKRGNVNTYRVSAYNGIAGFLGYTAIGRPDFLCRNIIRRTAELVLKTAVLQSLHSRRVYKQERGEGDCEAA